MMLNVPGIPDNVKVMYTEITKRCNWTTQHRIPLTIETIEEFVELEGVTVTTVKSFELIFHVLYDWKKLYNTFILFKLWTLSTRDVALETIRNGQILLGLSLSAH
ncbi:uncharacterized protein EV154DRAFT_559097 [Mucor mucedo]|uniref:uncharacterized protein n=1 Tax=Mucor mucedo TaxID=29922 RepID=UPI00221FA039|nr:uncharacterized protein EV154DRAFT_559097 [Mucor mucedo]KAI7895679.1 hypothetical protein EV154DRAFT_559097 [Mucor mucedo]